MMRRAIDLLFASLWLVITAPIMVLIAISIKIDTSGPILYTPRMVGYRGKEFVIFRFCTMLPATLIGSAQLKLTRVGSFIQNYSLDHLPTLINLLIGDLTLIGPRPMEVAVVDLQDPMWQQYCQIKPGLLNYAVLKLGKLWTPSRVSNPALNQELELEYHQKQSSQIDLQLFIRYLRAFVAGKGNVKARGKPDPDAESRLIDQ